MGLLSPALSSRGGEGEEPAVDFFTASLPQEREKHTYGLSGGGGLRKGLVLTQHSRGPKAEFFPPTLPPGNSRFLQASDDNGAWRQVHGRSCVYAWRQ